MLDFETFLTTLYPMVDDFCKSFLPHDGREPGRPGRRPKLKVSEVVTLAIFGQWAVFSSEREFYRWAQRRLKHRFPNLPTRPQFNRQMRKWRDVTVYFFVSLSTRLLPKGCSYEALDATAVVTRHAKRRGGGHLDGITGLGYCNRLGWYHGLHLLVASSPQGVITGYGFARANVKDQLLAETFFGLRAGQAAHLPSVGMPRSRYYVVDKGFEGRLWHKHWQTDYNANVICAPKRSRNPLTDQKWSKALRRWAASVRQIIESVNAKLVYTFRLERERPHTLEGFQARLAAKMALHNFCVWLNRQLGRAALCFTDLVNW
jgi:hypothetical protein